MNEVDAPKPLEDILAPKVGVYKPGSDKPETQDERPVELGGPKGPEPTRYGDWEKKGICIDF